MKPLSQQNNVERARLLFELFPNEMPAFISFMKINVQKILKNDEHLRDNWKGQLITVEFWLELAKKANECINKYDDKLGQKSRLFADQLFDGYNALLGSHCLSQYRQVASNQKFIKAIDIFFSGA